MNNLKIVYKLFRLKKDGNITSLFINNKINLKTGVWLKSKTYPTDGIKVRHGWHTVESPKNAPHLTNKGRIWKKVCIRNFSILQKPKCQGGKWYLAKEMKIIN